MGSITKWRSRCMGFPLMESVRGSKGTREDSLWLRYSVEKAVRQSDNDTASMGALAAVSDRSRLAACFTSLRSPGFAGAPREGELLRSDENGSVCVKDIARCIQAWYS